MQPSNKKTYIFRTAEVIAFILVFILINILLNALLNFPESESKKMFEGYAAHRDLDTLIVGNSITKMIDADVINEKTGFNSYNMGTPSQTFKISEMLIEMASSQNPVKRVVIVTGYDSFEKETNKVPEKIIKNAKNASKPLLVRKLREFDRNANEAFNSDTIMKTSSITVFFKWIDDGVGDIESIKENFDSRVLGFFTGKKSKANYAFDLDEEIYERNDLVYTKEDQELLEEDIDYLNSLDISSGVIDIESLEELDKICKYCKDNSIELIYYISPHQSAYKDRYSDNYEKVDNFLDSFMKRREVCYYNFENDPDIHDKLPDNYFYDWEHIKSKYTDKATEVFAEKLLSEAK